MSTPLTLLDLGFYARDHGALCAELGIVERTLKRWLTGESRPSEDDIEAIRRRRANVLFPLDRVPFESLIGGRFHLAYKLLLQGKQEAVAHMCWRYADPPVNFTRQVQTGLDWDTGSGSDMSALEVALAQVLFLVAVGRHPSRSPMRKGPTLLKGSYQQQLRGRIEDMIKRHDPKGDELDAWRYLLVFARCYEITALMDRRLASVKDAAKRRSLGYDIAQDAHRWLSEMRSFSIRENAQALFCWNALQVAAVGMHRTLAEKCLERLEELFGDHFFVVVSELWVDKDEDCRSLWDISQKAKGLLNSAKPTPKMLQDSPALRDRWQEIERAFS